ncbi:MAG: hypothetical protein ACOY93_19930 [Bacillota bacterium]
MDRHKVMAAVFVEEFMRMGLSPDGVMALFRNPFYTGPHSVLLLHGEEWVEGLIQQIFTGEGDPHGKG